MFSFLIPSPSLCSSPLLAQSMVVCAPCHSPIATLRVSDLRVFPKPLPSNLLRCPPLPRRRPALQPFNAAGPNLSSSFPAPQEQQQVRTLFPGGFKRPEISVPTLVLRLRVNEVLEREPEIDAALPRGVGVVVLDGGEESGARLYEAACALKSLVGDRAFLLIAERVDVAAAIGASGVVLSDAAIPTLVARNMMTKSKSDSVYLPLVARTVKDTTSAVAAVSSEGADFLIMTGEMDKFAIIQESSVVQQVKVPVFFSISDLLNDSLPSNMAPKLLKSGVSGIVISLNDLVAIDGDTLKMFSVAYMANEVIQDTYLNSRMETDSSILAANGQKGIPGFTKLGNREIGLIERERLLISEAVTIIQKATPMMKDISLLLDAASCLTEPFLMVIVGEFNSGKSTVINALLGKRYLKEGVVPTTNEITLLLYSEVDYDHHNRCERNPDGQIICYLSSPILKEMNLVDTPGTNVILQRQQRLTEEFVPRADLILFVLSADRPLTESEVAFLLYIQQWKKKVVFVLNKLDLYRTSSEVEEATSFIKENARKVLNAEDIRLFPVAARSALDAKLSYSNYNAGGHEEALDSDPRWISSRFYELEKFLLDLLDGTTETGMERVKLKLETPVAIADRLILSCQTIVRQEYEDACENLISINGIASSVKEYGLKIENESVPWRKNISSVILTAKVRALKLIDSLLQLSNVDLILTYALKSERAGSIVATSVFQNDIISPALSETQKLLADYSAWLESSYSREAKLYMECFEKRWPSLVDHKRRNQLETYPASGAPESSSLKVVENFSASAAARLFEQEIREAVIGTFGGLGAAGLSASLLTSVLPTTLEDLLALGFCSAGGWLAISSFPTRRKEAAEKVSRVADKLAVEITEAMEKEVMLSIEKLNQFVQLISKPYADAAQARIDRLTGIQNELSKVEQSLQALKVDIQNLHVL